MKAPTKAAMAVVDVVAPEPKPTPRKVYQWFPAGYVHPVPADEVKGAEEKLPADISRHEAEAETAEDAAAKAQALIDQVQAVLQEAQRRAEEHRAALLDPYRRRHERQEHLDDAEALQRGVTEGVRAREDLQKRAGERDGPVGFPERIDDLQEAATSLREAQAERLELLGELEMLNIANGGVRRALDARRLLAELDQLEAELEHDVARAHDAVVELVAFDAQLAEAIEKQRKEVEDERRLADHALIDPAPEPPEPKPAVRPFYSTGGITLELVRTVNEAWTKAANPLTAACTCTLARKCPLHEGRATRTR